MPKRHVKVPEEVQCLLIRMLVECGDEIGVEYRNWDGWISHYDLEKWVEGWRALTVASWLRSLSHMGVCERQDPKICGYRANDLTHALYRSMQADGTLPELPESPRHKRWRKSREHWETEMANARQRLSDLLELSQDVLTVPMEQLSLTGLAELERCLASALRKFETGVRILFNSPEPIFGQSLSGNGDGRDVALELSDLEVLSQLIRHPH